MGELSVEMSVVKKIGKVIGGVEEWVAMISFIAMVVVTIAIVLCRYVFKIEFMHCALSDDLVRL